MTPVVDAGRHHAIIDELAQFRRALDRAIVVDAGVLPSKTPSAFF